MHDEDLFLIPGHLIPNYLIPDHLEPNLTTHHSPFTNFIYNIPMFTYKHSITVRYRDLDPQGHVNNSVYLTYLEAARIGYYQQVGIYHPEDRILTGMVVVRNEIDYLAPIQLGQKVRVGLRIERLGCKSITFAFQMDSLPGGEALARGRSVMVAYDNETEQGVLIPPGWREKIVHYEESKGNHDLT